MREMGDGERGKEGRDEGKGMGMLPSCNC